MRTHHFFYLAFIIAWMTACGNDNSHKGEGNVFPAPVVEQAFFTKYPGAANVQWEKDGNFIKADFTLSQVEYESWFNPAGLWLQTEYSIAYSDLPPVVTDYVTGNLNYPLGSWRPEQSVDVLERLNYLVWYGVELQKGEEEVTLWADQDAYQHRDIAEDFSEEDIPQAIRNFMATGYAKGLVTEAGKLPNGSYIVNLLDSEEVKEVYFDRSMNWQYTEWPVLLENVPQVVKAVLDSPAYKDFSVKSVRVQQYSSGTRYHFVLKQSSMTGPDVALNVDSKGEIVL